MKLLLGLAAAMLLAKGSKPVFVPVQPVKGHAELRIGSGHFFNFALPERWRVGEDGQFALSLVAPDSKAFTVMVGNAGMPAAYPPAQFVYEKMSALQPQTLQLGPQRPARPVAGFSQAVEFDVSFVGQQGKLNRGVAKCSVQVSYDSAVYAMTAAISAADQWPGYASWLPAVADQISASNGGAFGVRGVMAQNLKNSTAYAEAARSYREWSQRTQRETTDARNASQDRINDGMRNEVLGGVKPYASPYGEKTPVELPLTYQHYWMDPKGNIVGTNDGSADPNAGAATEWRRLQPTR